MTLFAGATQVQKAYIGASAVNAIMHAGVNVLGVNGSFPGITDSELYLPLTNTLVPTRGASTPTFTRATVAWDFDSEGKLNLNIPSGCPRFTGARLVRNRIVNSDPSSASWTLTNCTVAQTTDPAGGSAAAVVTVTAGAGNTIRPTSQYSFTGDNRASFYFKPGTAEWCRLLIYDGSGNQARVWFNALTQQIGTLSTGGTGWTAVSAAISNEGSGWFRLQALASITGNTYFQINACDADNSTNYTTVAGKTITIAFPQSENVTGQADQTASEYVSVGVLSAPFHGAGVDGCKYFNTNKDGSAISAATLKGYYAEPSRVNNCLWSRDQRAEKWYTNGTGAELVVNGDFAASTGWTAEAGWAIGAGVLTGTATSANTYRAATLTTGALYDVTFDLVSRTAGLVSVSVGGTSISNWHSTVGAIKFKMVAGSNGTIAVKSAGFSGSIDNLSVKLSAIQVTTTTGLDNVANSASRLTAAANDATLLQLLTAATGTRTTSVYIKRISGSGTISLTRNGGTNWTDITSSLVTDTWVPVEVISDVGANPTVGLKMGTSGDVIDVDCFQDENGAWRTSPILTTTAAVTRNADVLSYTHAGILDDAQGTILASASVAAGQTGTTYILSTAGAQFPLYKGNSGANLGSSDGTTTLFGAAWANDGISRKCAVNWSGVSRKVCMNGGALNSGAYDGSWNATALYPGSAAGAIQLSGNIGEIHIWTTPLTDAQMQQVTS
jgi:hypothetical protein